MSEHEEHGKSSEHETSAGEHGKAGGHGHGKGKDKKVVDTWVAKGWTPLHLTAGATASDPIALDPATQDLSLMGQVFDATGNPIHGRSKPHAHVIETDTGAIVNLSAPLAQDSTFLYKIEDAGSEDAESFDDQQM